MSERKLGVWPAQGTFQMTFVPENVGKYSFFTSTDTLRFTEGRFRARLRRNTDPDWGNKVVSSRQ